MMKFLIKPPQGKGVPFIKEFASREELHHWLVRKNDEVWRADLINEKVNFPLHEIL
ncbi:hypothetical protein [Levilactobacillus brevis]|uniref:hypothetical protein n=1 Tax=Levilactobacillus brevis TaxID=1580 RepID=UPI0021A485B2|nr:hypothetical protein [Levilactobacillus brevis]